MSEPVVVPSFFFICFLKATLNVSKFRLLDAILENQPASMSLFSVCLIRYPFFLFDLKAGVFVIQDRWNWEAFTVNHLILDHLSLV